MRTATGLSLVLCLSLAVVTEGLLQTSEEEFTTCISLDLTESKVEKVLGYLHTYENSGNFLNRVRALQKLILTLYNNDILDCLYYEEPSGSGEEMGDDSFSDDFSFDTKTYFRGMPYGDDAIRTPSNSDDEDLPPHDEHPKFYRPQCEDRFPEEDCAKLKTRIGKREGTKDIKKLILMETCRKTFGLCGIESGEIFGQLKKKLTVSQENSQIRNGRSRRSLNDVAALQDTPGTCDDLISFLSCRAKRDRGDCLTDQVNMAEQCWATCECKECMLDNSCPSNADVNLLFPEPESNNNEKKYTYVRYTGNGLQDDITEGVTMCACVTPLDISNTLYVIADYGVSPVSYTDTYDNNDINRDLRKLRLEFNRNGIYLTADNQRTNLAVIPREDNLIMTAGTMSRLCVTYDLATKKATAYLDGRQGRATDMNANTDVLQGKGILVIGQDQARMEGGFDVNRALEGAVSHFKLYKKTFDEEVLGAATLENGEFPAGAEVDANTSNLRVFGRATMEFE